MAKLAQAGIAVSFLGGVIALIFGAFVYVQNAYYWGVKHNLAQQIGLRLSMTGLVVASAAGLADVLGYGSHPIGVESQKPFLGNWQAVGLIGGFVVASIGVIIFAVLGHPGIPDDPES